MLISGDKVGLSADKCVFAIFFNPLYNDDRWNVGSIWMEDYYTVYDESPYTQDN